MSHRKVFTLLAVLLGLARCVAPAFSAEDKSDDAKPKRPNILFIYADDQSYKTLGCYPESPDWVRTPNIDGLAQKGVRFQRCYLGAWCMPSRASILTGKLQHGVQTMRMEGTYPASTYDPEQCPFIPAQFRKQGYHTAQIGKWHTGIDTGYGRDWDYQMVWNRPGHPENAARYFYNQIVTNNGVDQEIEGYSTDNYTKWADAYIRGENRDETKPWYLWLCYGAIHGPTTPADRHIGTFQGKSGNVPADIFGPRPEKPAYLNDTQAWDRGPNGVPVMRNKVRAASNFDTIDAGKTYDAWVQQVNECMLAVDEGVGTLLKTLEETGQLENTLVVYVADQGYALGEHGFNQKVAPYDATIASPLIISFPPRFPQGKLCPHPVNAPDLTSFLCDVAEVDIPWETHARDISALVAEPEKTEWKSPMLFVHTARIYGSDTDIIPTNPEDLSPTSNTPWYVMLRDGKYKYVRTLVPGEMEEVYDLDADPEELVNLALRAEHKGRLRQLRQLAISELKRTKAGFIDKMPPTRDMLEAAAN
ncbi:MAG: sulfatase-like hydrolase/transferase [Planctomycetaceae bacterium]